ncbi:MAG: hypothetical protein OJF50_001217 [Nitrospira sp.]|nr:hypothetical protein [Nitrospira sp.]
MNKHQEIAHVVCEMMEQREAGCPRARRWMWCCACCVATLSIWSPPLETSPATLLLISLLLDAPSAVYLSHEYMGMYLT